MPNANEMPGSGMFIQTNMGVPTVGAGQGAPTVGLGQTVYWNSGSSMEPNTVVPLLPGHVFSARGRGAQSLTTDPALGSRVSGVQGSLDLLVTMGAAGTARTLCILTDNPTSPVRYLAVKIDATNRPFGKITNNLGAVIGVVSPSYAAIAAGQPVLIRLAWDSVNVVDVLAARRATFRVNRDLVASGDWTTNPAAAWAAFQPTHIVLGASLGDADFNGTISAVQVSNSVTP